MSGSTVLYKSKFQIIYRMNRKPLKLSIDQRHDKRNLYDSVGFTITCVCVCVATKIDYHD